MTAAPFSDAELARSFIRAGNARVTVCSQRTGQRYTFRVRAATDSDPADAGRPLFVETLTGRDNSRDYTYLGMAKRDRFFSTKATRHMEGSAQYKAFRHVYEHLCRRKALPPGTEIWHESACGRCGRPLTVPNSIATGIGPECAKYMGA